VSSNTQADNANPTKFVFVLSLGLVLYNFQSLSNKHKESPIAIVSQYVHSQTVYSGAGTTACAS